MSDPPASQQPRGFRAQQRFSYPALAIPPDWTATTPPHGFAAQPALERAAPLPVAVPPVDYAAVPPAAPTVLPPVDYVASPAADHAQVPPVDYAVPPVNDVVQPDQPVAVPAADPVAVPPVDPVAVPSDDPVAVPSDDPVAVPADDMAVPVADPVVAPADDVAVPAVPTADPVAVPSDDSVAVPPVDPVAVPSNDPVAVSPADAMLPPAGYVTVSPDDVALPPLEFVALSSFAPPPAPDPPLVDPPAEATLAAPQRTPAKGWRRWLHNSTLGTVTVGPGAKATRYETMTARANRPLRDCYRIALLSLKGGVGKTTITATLGATFAAIRDDRVIAVDANPDRGTLNQKVPLETASTVRHLLRDAEGIDSYDDVRKYTSRGASRLEVLASESDPAVSEAFSAQDYDQTLAVLERFYNLVLTDCGTGLLHSAMSSVLNSADLLVVVSSGSVDGARSASATLDWLDAHGHEQLVRDAVAVVNAVRPRSGRVDLDKVTDHFARRCRAVVHVPFDPHLEAGAEIDLDRLKGPTRDALLELASKVGDGFPALDGPVQPS